MSLKFFMLAGEASGDAHAARLIEALQAHLGGGGDTPVPEGKGPRFIGMGGPKMAAAGMELAKDLEGMQVLGFWEVAKKYGFFRDVFYKLLDRVKQEKPDALICVDYPGFNLRFAKEVKKLGIPVLYYIVPQVWAWKPKRPKAMAEFVDRAFCIFDFEPPFFEKYGLKTEFVGHPLVDKRGTMNDECGLKLPPGPKTVAFLPGSRTSEFSAHWPDMNAGYLIASDKNKKLRGILSIGKGIRPPCYPTQLQELMNRRALSRVDPPISFRPNYRVENSMIIHSPDNAQHIAFAKDVEHSAVTHSSLLPSLADFSVVKSGTSTLEAGLAGNPMCAVYKAPLISYTIGRLLVNIPVFSLVNIVLGRYVVPELLQSDVTPARIAAEIERGLNDEKYREQQKAALAELPKKLGGPGASSRAAKGIVDFLKGR